MRTAREEPRKLGTLTENASLSVYPDAIACFKYIRQLSFELLLSVCRLSGDVALRIDPVDHSLRGRRVHNLIFVKPSRLEACLCTSQ